MAVLWTGAAHPADPASDNKIVGKPMHVVLIGASIGQEWNLPELPGRLRFSGYEFEALQAWQFDKSEKVDETLIRPARKFHLTPSYFKGFFRDSPKPADVVILKECASYFPEDTSREQKQKLLMQWVREVREKNIKVMVATVVPVTKKLEASEPAQQRSLLAYNDWLRDYARKESIPVLDLEAALRPNERERYLPEDLSIGDGKHLNRKAYDILDGVMAQTLCRAFPSDTCSQVRVSAR
jgi:hypothetical protein